MHKSNIITKLINAAVFILLEVAALVMLKNNGPLQNSWLSKGGHAFMGSVWGVTENISDYFSLRQQNESLAQENFMLMDELQRYRDILPHADSLFMMKADKYAFISAEISKSSRNTQHNYFIIDKGSRDGVERGCGVMTSKGVVGIVESVSENYSYALSFLNSQVSISARLGHDGSIGPLAWDGRRNKHAILSEIPGHITVAPGDTVYTSGYSSTFPADLPLGQVVHTKIVNGATHEIDVELFEDFSKLRYVTVVQNNFSEEIKKLEEQYEN